MTPTPFLFDRPTCTAPRCPLPFLPSVGQGQEPTTFPSPKCRRAASRSSTPQAPTPTPSRSSCWRGCCWPRETWMPLYVFSTRSQGRIPTSMGSRRPRRPSPVMSLPVTRSEWSAWSLPSTVKKAEQLTELLRHSHFVTLHVPLMDATRDMIDAGGIAQMKHSAVLLNFSRNGVVDESAVLEGLANKQLAKYVCDFPSRDLAQHSGVILLPHLGASTREAEENCAVMVADQVRDYLLDGTIRNS